VGGEPDLAGLEAERARLYAELSGVGDFRRGMLGGMANDAQEEHPAAGRI
jgi:hypothetical protein